MADCDDHHHGSEGAGLEALLDAAPFGQLLLDRDLQLVWANTAATRMGFLACDAATADRARRIPGAARSELEALAEEVRSTGSERCRHVVIADQGAERHWQLRAFPVQKGTGGPAAIGVVVDDVTTHQRAVAALSESRSRLQALFDSSRVGIVVRDEQARVLECNQAFATMMGHPAEALIGTDFSAILAPSTAERAMQAFRARWAGHPLSAWLEGPMALKDGRVIHARATASQVYDDAGEPIFQLVLIEDRTEQKELEDSVVRAERIESIGRLAGGVAHDFNNMLGIIIGFTEIVAEQLGPRHALQSELGEIRHAAEHSRALTRELLAFGRQQLLAREPVAPGAIVEGLRPQLAAALGAGVELVVEDGAAGATIVADRAQLEAVILKLAQNGGAAMPRGGRLTVRTACDHDDGTGAVTISIADTGDGMADHERERIFEPFFSPGEQGAGSGLGLATTLGTIEQMGGTIVVDSTRGIGTTFVVTMPMATAVAEPAEVAAPAGSGRYAILVVEDEPQLRTLLQRLLERDGHTVLTAADGAGAMALLRDPANVVDLLLSDMMLPDVHGGDLAREALEIRPGLRVLYSSGYAGADVARDGMPPGHGFLGKPYSREDLHVALRAVFSADGGPREAGER